VRIADGLDVEGPVRAELFVVWLHGDQLELTGPCGAAPWLVELGEGLRHMAWLAMDDPVVRVKLSARLTTMCTRR